MSVGVSLVLISKCQIKETCWQYSVEYLKLGFTALSTSPQLPITYSADTFFFADSFFFF